MSVEAPRVLGIVIHFGMYQGARVTDLPVDYLEWMCSLAEPMVRDGQNWSAIARAELNRRGGAYGMIVPSRHALDRFSQRHLDRWLSLPVPRQGMASYLATLATRAWDEGREVDRQHGPTGHVVKKQLDDIVFVYQCDARWTARAVKTVLRAREES